MPAEAAPPRATGATSSRPSTASRSRSGTSAAIVPASPASSAVRRSDAAKYRPGREVVGGHDHGCPAGRRAVHGPVTGEGSEDEHDSDERERLREPPPGRGARRRDFLRAAKAKLRPAVLARLHLDVGCSLETHLRPKAPSRHRYAGRSRSADRRAGPTASPRLHLAPRKTDRVALENTSSCGLLLPTGYVVREPAKVTRRRSSGLDPSRWMRSNRL